ncbi:MAG: hypothetical protein WCH04_20230, partial [Gammaproteobacteria bacterium]
GTGTDNSYQPPVTETTADAALLVINYQPDSEIDGYRMAINDAVSLLCSRARSPDLHARDTVISDNKRPQAASLAGTETQLSPLLNAAPILDLHLVYRPVSCQSTTFAVVVGHQFLVKS